MTDKSLLYSEGLALDVSGNVEKKGQFSYLSWPFAVARTKERYPDFHYWLVENTYFDEERKVLINVPYFDGPKGAWIKLGLTLDGDMDHAFHYWFPILDNRNKPILEPTSFDVNTAQKRGLVKAIAIMTGIGLYIYAGEDLPAGIEANGKLASQEMIEKFCKLIDHPAMHLPISTHEERSRNHLLIAKYDPDHGGKGWVKDEIIADAVKVTEYLKKWESENQLSTVGGLPKVENADA
jgi:hypothetical protein